MDANLPIELYYRELFLIVTKAITETKLLSSVLDTPSNFMPAILKYESYLRESFSVCESLTFSRLLSHVYYLTII